jgi:phospholipid transport system transporter-binding protein
MASITANPNSDTLTVSGNLNFANAVQLANQGRELIKQNQQQSYQFDFSQVEHSNSVGLSLMLVWLRYGKQQGCQIRFSQVPASLLAMAQAYGLVNTLALNEQLA